MWYSKCSLLALLLTVSLFWPSMVKAEDVGVMQRGVLHKQILFQGNAEKINATLKGLLRDGTLV